MPKYEELVADERIEPANKYISTRWEQLHALEKSEGDRIFRYLFLVNAGGAIAVLSFIGTLGLVHLPSSTMTTLFSFGLGLILIGLSHAVRYYHFSSVFKHWQTDTGKFYESEIGWQELLNNDKTNTNSVLRLIVQILCWISFSCFIYGCIKSGVALYFLDPTPLPI